MWFSIAPCVCSCPNLGAYLVCLGYGQHCGGCGQIPLPVGPKEIYIPNNGHSVERGSRVQLQLKVRGRRVAA